jgi:hypothetical protein
MPEIFILFDYMFFQEENEFLWNGLPAYYLFASTSLCTVVIVSGAGQTEYTRLFLQSSELGPSHPLIRKRVRLPPHFDLGGGTHSLAGEGVGESQFGRGDRHLRTLGIYVLCGIRVALKLFFANT